MSLTLNDVLALTQYLPNKKSDFGRYLLPTIFLHRLDMLLKASKADVLNASSEFDLNVPSVIKLRVLQKLTGQSFYNLSRLDLESCLNDPANIRENLNSYLQGFDDDTKDVFDKFSIQTYLDILDEENTLYIFFKELIKLKLGEGDVSTKAMGGLYEEMIRHFAELSNEDAGKRFTPRDVIALMVMLLFSVDAKQIESGSLVRTCYDPVCGTGGMLNLSEEFFHGFPSCNLVVHGQEMDKETYATCKSLRIIAGLDSKKIMRGDSFSEDKFSGEKFDYIFANPPFGESWRYARDFVLNENNRLGHAGRFGAGYPELGDGTFLFIQHILSKFKNREDGGSRAAVITNGSPLFSSASSAEPLIRKHLLEGDFVEAIIGLPDDMFYSTPISTYIWIFSSNKPKWRQNKIQLINAAEFHQKMRKKIGSKGKELGKADIENIVKTYLEFTESKNSKIFDSADFGYTTITIEQPLRDKSGNIVLTTKGKAKGRPTADSQKRDTENVPLQEDIHEYFKREVLPHSPDAWIDESKSKVGYEIPFTRHFYEYQALRSLAEIDADIALALDEIVSLYTNNKIKLKKLMEES